MKRPFLLSKRGEIWYYKLAGETTYHSTGQTAKGRAQEYCLGKIAEREKRSGPSAILRAYLAPFYVWETCPHVRRLQEDGRRITRRHVHGMRRLIEGKILKDPIADLPVREIRRADVLDFRSRLLSAGTGARTVNRTIAVLKVAFREGMFREELERDPTGGVGMVNYDRKVPGTFSPAEIAALFPEEPPGPWKDLLDYTCFILAATTGLRRGEILALRWKAVDLAGATIRVEEAWKGGDEFGLPKSGKPREVPMPSRTVQALAILREEGIRTSPEDRVICEDDGTVPRGTWWKKHFASAMRNAGIDVKARSLRPHSFRHTLNTILLDGGMDPAKVRALLGWTNTKVQDGYTHWQPEHLREGAEKIEQIMRLKEGA
jgi:integrase